MKTYLVELKVRAECEDDAEELILDYTGRETDVEILNIEVPNEHPREGKIKGDVNG